MANADRLMQEGQSLLSSAGKGFSFFGNKADKYEEAAEKFRDAGNAYRTARDLQKSGQAFEKASEVQARNMNDPLESAKMLQDAFKSYREISPNDAVRVLDASIRLYTQKGNFRRAADLMCDLGDTYERMENNSKALECLETAITWYTDEGIKATANKARQKAGPLAAMQEDWYKAVDIFVKGAEASLATGPTGRFIATTYLFKAGICQVATGDVVGSNKAIESWDQMHRGFLNDREGRFLRDLIDALEAQEPDRVAQIAADWDRMTKMEDWMVPVLLKVKKEAEGQADDFS